MPESNVAGFQARRNARLLLAMVVIALAVWVAHNYLIALAWAVLIAIATWPLYLRTCAHLSERNRRRFGPLLFTLLVLIVVMIPLVWGAIELGRESQTALEWVKDVQKRGLQPPQFLSRIPVAGQYAERWWQDNLSDPQREQQLLGDAAKSALGVISEAGVRLTHAVVNLLIIFLALFALYRNGPSLAGRVHRLAHRWLGEQGQRLVRKQVTTARGVVNGTVLVAFGEAAIIGVGYVVAGVPYPVLFTALTAMSAMLPMGAWFSFGVASLILLAQGHVLAAGVLFGFGAAVMIVGDNFVQPAIIGGASHLPFLAALVGILGGLESFGLIGLFLGPVIMAALLAVWHEWLDGGSPAANER